MDEWLSHRSAKPSTAVRIRFGPQKTLLQALVEGFLIFTPLFTPLSTHKVIRILDLKIGGNDAKNRQKHLCNRFD